MPGVNPNLLPPREAMGLPETLVCRAPAHLLGRHRHLLALPVDALADLAEDPARHFADRHAAGTLLGLIGDPRIDVFAPRIIAVAGGRYAIGTPPADAARVAARWAAVGVRPEWIAKECPRHEVMIGAFGIGRYPVTNGEYRVFLTQTGRRALPSSWRLGTYPAHLANHPVWTVHPDDAQAYASWLSRATGRRFRLPSETEWEVAAAGQDGREFPWGPDADGDRANTVEDGPLCTTPVGIYPRGAAASGALDMAGNVEELVADLYMPYPGADVVDDDLARHGAYHVARGGGFTRYADLARCRRRHGWQDGLLYPIGFRLAEDAF